MDDSAGIRQLRSKLRETGSEAAGLPAYTPMLMTGDGLDRFWPERSKGSLLRDSSQSVACGSGLRAGRWMQQKATNAPKRRPARHR